MTDKYILREVIQMSNEEKLTKVGINWFPGHMAKTYRLLKEEIKNIDIVYELVDARIPMSSKIKNIDNLIQDKAKILIMTKMDLCDLKETNKWVKYYEEEGYKVLLTDLKKNEAYQKIIDVTHELTKQIQDKRKSKGLKEKEIKAMVLGIPNVGKSTLINKLTKRKSANVENKPGVTKNLNYLKTNDGIIILDTPGILWPKLDDQIVAKKIAATGGIKREILNMDDIAVFILNFLAENYPNILKEKYGITSNDIEEMYYTIATKIGAMKNNEVDYDRVSTKIYNDIVTEKITGITFDIYR